MPATLEAAGMLMRDSATSAMRGWEQKKTGSEQVDSGLEQVDSSAEFCCFY
jgi:hypothetical protein